MHPLGYFALAPNGTSDAAILKQMVSRYSGYKGRLDSEQKLGLGALLSYYKFYKLKYKSLYTVSDALIDAMPLCTKVSIHNLLLTHEGISNDSALGLIKFLTSQRRERAVNRELLSVKTVWLSLYGNGSSNQVETVPGGFQ